MQLKLSFEKRAPFAFTLWEPGVGRALLWHTGRALPGRTPFNRTPFTVNSASAGNRRLERADSLDGVRAWKGTGAGIFFQQANWMYLRLREGFADGASCGSYPWHFDRLFLSTSLGLTDGDFFVSDGAAYKTGVVSGYRIKLSADDNSYSQIKFSNLNFTVVWEKIKDVADSLIGSHVLVGVKETGAAVERQFVENFTRNLDTATIFCKDPRAALKQPVVDRQFSPFYWKSPTDANGGRMNHVDGDTLKKHIPDAVGWCCGVPGVCVNGYAGTADPYRYYRFCYGDFTPELVELQVENGWVAIDPVRGTSTNGYILMKGAMPETLPSGVVINTTVLRVPVKLVHPPIPGTATPDVVDMTPRTIRVTGTFHAERPNPAAPYEILRYLFERYSQTPWNGLYFDIDELKSELAPLDSAPIGIFVDKPTELYKVIASLQDGSVMGWKFASYGGAFTARLHNPGREVKAEVKRTDVINLYGLELDNCGGNYVSDAFVRYAKNWSEDGLWSEYRDESLRQEIIALRGADVLGGVETLLKTESDAKKRFANFTGASRNITPRIAGIKLFGEKWFGLREYDVLKIDFGDLTPVKFWYVLSVEIDVRTERVAVKVMAKL